MPRRIRAKEFFTVTFLRKILKNNFILASRMLHLQTYIRYTKCLKKIKIAISVGAALLADSVSGEGFGYIASSEEVGEGGREGGER